MKLRPSERGRLAAFVVVAAASAAAVGLLGGSSSAQASPQAALPPHRSGPGWLDDYNLPISPSLIIQSEWVLRIGKVCSERQPGYDERFVPLFAKWKAAHLQSLAAGKAEFESIQLPPGVTSEEALSRAADGFELEFRESSAEKTAFECASVLAELEEKTTASK